MERVERGADDDDLDDDDEVVGAIAASPAVATPRATVDARLRRSTCSDISERSEPSSWGVASARRGDCVYVR